jgi:hypothetical protein
MKKCKKNVFDFCRLKSFIEIAIDIMIDLYLWYRTTKFGNNSGDKLIKGGLLTLESSYLSIESKYIFSTSKPSSKPQYYQYIERKY